MSASSTVPSAFNATLISLRNYASPVFLRANPLSVVTFFELILIIINTVSGNISKYTFENFTITSITMFLAPLFYFNHQIKSPQSASIPGFYGAEARAAAIFSIASILILTSWLAYLALPFYSALLLITMQSQFVSFQWYSKKVFKSKKTNPFRFITFIVSLVFQIFLSFISFNNDFIIGLPAHIALPIAAFLIVFLIFSILSSQNRTVSSNLSINDYPTVKMKNTQQQNKISNTQLKYSILGKDIQNHWLKFLFDISLIPLLSVFMSLTNTIISHYNFSESLKNTLPKMFILLLFPQSFVSDRTHWAPLFATGYFGSREKFVRTLFTLRLKQMLLQTSARTSSFVVFWSLVFGKLPVENHLILLSIFLPAGISLGFTETIPFIFNKNASKQSFLFFSLIPYVLLSAFGNPFNSPRNLVLITVLIICSLGAIGFFLAPKYIQKADWPYETP
ncbi:hypothetical protein D5366_07030 [Neokomagataea tanensis]|uniref:Uncharacterized protein n=1 Tax=Neokomagataea tanensis TaxID=661191 RepID=A0A4Y6V9G4_9PROT|nr:MULTISPECIES: hypothetical protein [Neokomagataea]QDH25005.1 hypothetical protein D5366_07030 [Neokomagataea tanensis]